MAVAIPGTKHGSTKACVSSSPAGGLPCNPVRGASRAVSATAWDDSAQATGGPSTGSAARFAGSNGCTTVVHRADLSAAFRCRQSATNSWQDADVLALPTDSGQAMQSAACSRQHAAYNASCGRVPQHATQTRCNTDNLQHRQDATDNMQPTTCNRQQTTDSAHYAPWG